MATSAGVPNKADVTLTSLNPISARPGTVTPHPFLDIAGAFVIHVEKIGISCQFPIDSNERRLKAGPQCRA
jgi:hypothetical protein